MLKHDIGIDAGVIWRLLSGKGALSIREIGEFTHFEEKMIILSLGRLAREDKISLFEQNGVISHIHSSKPFGELSRLFRDLSERFSDHTERFSEKHHKHGIAHEK